MQKQGLERGGSWNPASGRGSHRAEGPLGSCVACRAGLNPRSLCTFKVANQDVGQVPVTLQILKAQ